MKILHLSDFHIGEQSLNNDTKFPTIPNDYLYILKKFISNKLSKPDLVIFTGDLVSRGKTIDLNSPIIEEFFQYFIKARIPILCCNGNHDLDENMVQDKKQFMDYSMYILKEHEQFGITLSDRFSDNLASFIDFPKYNSLFISLNSCFNIISSSNETLKPATLPYSIIDPFFRELRNKVGWKFDHRNKFVIVHHPLEKLKEHNDSIRILHENRILGVFNGDSHKFDIDDRSIKGVLGMTTGTMYGANKIKWNDLNLIMQPNQFNYYELEINRMEISIGNYIRDLSNGEWCLGNEKTIPLDLEKLWTISEFSKQFHINEEKFKQSKIKYVFRDTSREVDYIGFTSKGLKSYIFHLNSENQVKTNIIRDFYKESQLHNLKSTPLLIIDATHKLKGQLPEEIIIEAEK